MSGTIASIIASFVKQAAKTSRENILVIDSEKITYGQLLHRVSQQKKFFESRGIACGDNVLITVAPSVDFYASLLAVFSIGAVVVVLDTSMGLTRANHCIRLAKPVAWIHRRGEYWYFKYISSVIRAIPLDILIDDAPPIDHDIPVEVTSSERALATFTTGSTSLPKIMYRTHDFMLQQSRAVSHTYMKIHGMNPADSVMGSPQEATEAGFTNMPILFLHQLKLGATSMLHSRIKSYDPAAVVALMEDTAITNSCLSPAIAYQLCLYCIKHNRQLPTKVLAVGGAPIYQHMARVMLQATTDQRAVIVYGSTESDPISLTDVKTKLAKESESNFMSHFVGPPFIDGGVRIVQTDADGTGRLEDVEMSQGEVGEIVVSGWHVNTEDAPESRILKDHYGKSWLKVGDAGYLDKEGNVWLVGRVSWVVERNGKKHWSVITEEKVLQFLGDKVTLVAYVCRNKQAHLIIEAPNGLKATEEQRLRLYLQTEDIPVDCMRMYKTMPRDRRHNSKPDMAKLFSDKKPSIGKALVTVVLGMIAFGWLLKHLNLQVALYLALGAIIVVSWLIRSLYIDSA